MGRYSKRKRKKLKDQVYSILTAKFNAGEGRSRYNDKKTGIDKNYIYAIKTYKTYMEQCKRFADWCRERDPALKTIKDCRVYVDAYLQKYIDEKKSAWTIKTIACSLGKLYGETTCNFIATPGRARADISRSRKKVETDRFISKEMEQYYARLTSCTGLRRREMLKVKGTALFYDEKGNPWLNVTEGTKGGKERLSPVIGTKEEKEFIIDLFNRSKDRRVVNYMPKTYDNHHYRSVYAIRLYNELARPVEEIPFKEKYCCRRELTGVVYDREAMKFVSKALGHTRESVIAGYYLNNISE